MESTIPKQAASLLDQPREALVTLVLTDQQLQAFRQPGQRPSLHPAASLAPIWSPLRTGIFTRVASMADIAVPLDHLPGGCVVVSGVQTQVLLDLLGVGTLDDHRTDCLIEQPDWKSSS